jgi:hypothetical protein
VEIKRLGLIVVTIYRIPKQTKAHIGIFLCKLEQLLDFTMTKYKRKKIVICGDWNIDLLKQNRFSRDLLTLLHNYNFTAHIVSPTRKKTCIDQIASNIKDADSRVIYLGLSDHETAQLITLKTHKQKAFTTWFEYRRDYNDHNVSQFTKHISSIYFSEVLESSNITEAFSKFYETVLLFYRLCFPLIKVKVNNRANTLKWLTRGLKLSCRTKRKLYISYQKIPKNKKQIRNDLNKKIKIYSSILKKSILTAQKINNKKYIDKNRKSSKAIWNSIANTMSNSQHGNNINYITINNVTFNDPQKICDIFNDYFIDLTQHDSTSHDFSDIQLSNPHTIYLTPVTDSEIYNIIMTLKNSKSSGYDDITTTLIKLVAKNICRPITHIVNLSFEQGRFPEELKMSVVKPIFKKGDECDPCNYRPITIIPIISKILEKAMLKRLNDFLLKFNILHPQQFGFRKNSSTTTACFDLIRYVTENLNNKTPIASIFLDMTKAFDFVNHERLMRKLEKYGIRGKTYDWVKDYLKDRKQCTEISQIVYERNSLVKTQFRSTFRINSSGVPQGTIIAPLLFLCYINDLPHATQHKPILFADDTTLIIKCDKTEPYNETLNKALADTATWLKTNNLQINTIKTKIMEFRSYNTNELNIQLKYDNEYIQNVDSFKILGIILDKHLNFKEHIDYICNRLERYVYALKRIRQTISTESALVAYYGYVSSVISYGLIIWGNSVDMERVFILQKKCIRAINNAWFLDSCKPLFIKMKILPLPSIYIRDICLFVKSHSAWFKLYTDESRRPPRAQYLDLLHHPPCRTYIYKQSAYNMSIVIYNSLPGNLKKLQGHLFKKNLTEWLTEKCFYSLKEYLDINE